MRLHYHQFSQNMYKIVRRRLIIVRHLIRFENFCLVQDTSDKHFIIGSGSL